MKRRAFELLIGVLFFMGPFWGQTQSASKAPSLGAPDAVSGGTFRMTLSVAPATLNPLTAIDTYAGWVLPWMAESLLARNEETYEWVSQLAESYAVSQDKMSFTFVLRQGVLFHDGSELTADDVHFSLSPETASLYPNLNLRLSKGVIKSVKVLDRYQVVVETASAVFSNLEAIATALIVPKKLYADKNFQAKANKSLVATGPYKLEEFNVNQHLRLVKNDAWWGAKLPEYKNKFNFDKIVVRFAIDDGARLRLLEAGEVDFAPISSTSYLKRTQGKAWGKTVFSGKFDSLGLALAQDHVIWNLHNPIFQSRQTRKALQMLLDRRLINEKLYGGLSDLATGPWNRANEAADPNVKPIEYDPEGASRILKQEGWQDSDNDGVLDKNISGHPTPFRFTVFLASGKEDMALTLYQQALKKAGIDMQLQPLDWTLTVKKVEEAQFDAYWMSIGQALEVSPKSFWHSKFTTKGHIISNSYGNPEVDRLIESAEGEFDRARRLEILRNTYRLIADDFPVLFMFSTHKSFFAHSKRLQIPKANFKYSLGLNYWWIKP